MLRRWGICGIVTAWLGLAWLPLQAQEGGAGGQAKAALGVEAKATMAVSAPMPKSAVATEKLEVLPSRHLAVSVKINGKGPLRMILDTGSPLTFLGNAAAQRCGLITAAQAKQPAMFGMRGQMNVKSVEVGGTRLKDFSVLVFDHPIIEALGQVEGPIDGIIGFSFFARYRTVIDYAAKTVQFAPGTYQPEDVMTGLVNRLLKGEGSRRVLASQALWGMEVGHPDAQPGVVVTRVYPQSAAFEAGLQVGDRMLQLDGRWTDTAEDCIEAAGQVQAGEAAELQIQRAGKPLVLSVTPRPGL